jgi:phosphoribosyl 1,2-cyclic phosphodiesterase
VRTKLRVNVWGVRGSIPTPDAGSMSYGGNTPCLEIQYGDLAPLILDAGSGLRRLGLDRAEKANGHGTDVHVLFSHFHWDHIQGLPFFGPLYQQNSSITFYSSREPADLQGILRHQMQPPYFPVKLSSIDKRYQYCKIGSEGMPWGDLHITPFPLRHPDGCTGYRIESPTSCVVYASDHEHGDARYDAILEKHAAGADMLIYDAQYTPEEYSTRGGWGHSTWLAGTRVAREAGVRRLLLFHHDPGHDDQTLDEMVKRAGAEFENTSGAREGTVHLI